MSLTLILATVLVAAPPSHELYRAQLAAAEASERLGEHAEARAWLDATLGVLH